LFVSWCLSIHHIILKTVAVMIIVLSTDFLLQFAKLQFDLFFSIDL
jgi:hypothetical protein